MSVLNPMSPELQTINTNDTKQLISATKSPPRNNT